MCVEERWSSWSIVGSIVLSKIWLEYGLSSSHIKTNDVRNVVLLVVDPSSIHHYIFWVWPILSHCSHNGGSPVIWKFRWVAVEPISNILSPHDPCETLKLALETFVSIIFVPDHEEYVGWKKWLPLVHVHLKQVAAVNLRKFVYASLGTIPSQSCMCEVCYGLTGSQPSFHMYP